MGITTWSVLASIKWLLLGLVAALGIGKIAVRCASWAVNYFFEAWLRWRPLCFSRRGVSYCLRGLRAGSIEVDLLYGWARSGGRLPCLAIVVTGLELRLEAFRSRGDVVGVTVPPVGALAESPSPEGKTGRLSPFWANFILRMVGWYSAMVLDARILTEFHAGGGGMESVEGGESLSPSAVVTTEVFVSSFEACTKQLDDGSGGVKLVVRVVQDADHVMVYPSTDSPGGSATFQGAVSLEVEVVPLRGKRLPAYSPALMLRSASVSSGAPWRAVVGERDIEAFATLLPAPLESPAAGTPRALKDENPPGSGNAGFVVASASASVRSSKPGAVLDPSVTSLFSLLSPLFRFDASFEGIRLEVLEGEGAAAVDTEGGLASCLECREGDPGVARSAEGENIRARDSGGAKGIFATSECRKESGRSGCSKFQGEEASVSAVAEIKGARLSLALGSVVAGEDVTGKEIKVSFSVKWSSAVLAAGKSFPLDEAQAQSFSRRVSSSVELLSLGLSRSVEDVVGPGDRGDGGDGAWAKWGVRRTCLPIHLGKLSCSGETVIDFSGPSVEIDVSGRLAFLRLTISRGGLSVLLWLAALGRRVPLSPMPSSKPPSKLNSLPSQRNLARGHGTPLVAGSGTGIRRRIRVSYTVSFRVDRACVGLVGYDDQVFEGRPGPARAADDGGDGWGSRRRDWSAHSSSSTVEDSPTCSSVVDGEDARVDAGADSIGSSSSSRGYLKEPRAYAYLVRVTIPRIAIRASSSQLTTAPSEASVSRGAAHDVGPKISVVAKCLEGHLEMDDPETSAVVPQPSPLNGEVHSVMPTFFDSIHGGSSSPSPLGVGDDSRQSARSVTHRLRWLAVRKLSFESGATRTADDLADDAVSKEASTATQSLGVGGGGREEPSRPGVGLAVEGVWAEWTPALFFLLGESGVTIKSCLTKSGFVRPQASKSSLRYDPLSHWSPPSPSPPPGVDPRGPARGFPGAKFRLQPVREPSRVDACLSNKVFVESPAINLLWGGGHRASPPSPGVEEVKDDGGEAGAARRIFPVVFSATGDGRLDRDDGGTKSSGIPKVLAVSARDVRVEFPYQRGVCSGDMERGDVIRWLRRFCRFGFQGYGFPATQGKRSRLFRSEGEGVVNDVGGGTSWSCQFVEARDFDLSVVTVGDVAGVSSSSQGSGSGVRPQMSCAISGVSVFTAEYYSSSADSDDGAPGLHGSAESGAETSPRSKGTRDSTSPSWAAPSPPGRQGFTVPSVSPIGRTVTPVTSAVARRAGLDVYGGRRSIRWRAPIGRDETRSGTAAATAAATPMKGLEGASGSLFSLSESNARRTALGRTSCAMLGVFLGGTRHCANTRQKILQVSRFAVLNMASDSGAEISRDDGKGGSSARVVDIFAEGVTGDWSPSTHLHIIKPVRDVTLSVWKLMLHLRRAGLPEPVDLGGATGQNASSRWNRTPPLEDPAALEYWMRAWAAGGSSGPGGDTLHRLHVRDVALRGRWPAQPDLSATAPPDVISGSSSAKGVAAVTPLFPGRSAEDDAVRVQVGVDEFSSESVGEHFSFSNTTVDLDGDRLASVASVNITRTLAQGRNTSDPSPEAATPPADPADRLIVGACFHELKARALALDGDNWGSGEGERRSRVREHSKSTATPCAGGRPTEAWLMRLVTRPEGFMVEMEGVVIRAERGRELGNRLDCLAVQFRALARALAELPGRWHPLKGGPCDDFHRLFWKPPIPEEAFVASSTRPQDRAWGTHIWLRAREVSVEFADDPLEAWLEAMLSVWSKELATRAFRHALRRRRRCLSGSGEDREEDTRSYMRHVRETFGERGPPLAFPLLKTTRKEASRSKAGGDICESSPSLMRTRVGSVSADVTPPFSGEIMCRGLLERLDQHPPPVGTEFGTIARISYAARCTDISVHLRRVANPTFSCEAVTAGGDAMGVWVRAPPSFVGCTPVVLEELPVPRDSAAAAVAAPRAEGGVSGAGLSAQVPMKATRQGGEGVELGGTVAADVMTVLTRDFPPKVYLDLTVVLQKPRFEFSPAHSYALVDVANAAKLLLPPGVFSQLESERRGRRPPRPRAASPPEAVAIATGGEASVSPLAPWDVGRCMVHGKFDATLVGGIALMIAGTETTPPTTRLPSREFLAAAAVAEAAAAAADTAPGSSDATIEPIRRGSFPPPAARGTTASAGVVGDGGKLSTGPRLSWRWRDRGAIVGNAFPEAGARTGGLERHGGIPWAGSPSTLPDVSGLSDASGGVRGSYSESVGSQHSGGAGSIYGVSKFSTGKRLRDLKPTKVLTVSCVVLRLEWAGAGRLELEATGIGAEVSPTPASGLPPLLEVPSLRCAIVPAWQTLGGPSPDHWVYVRRPSAQTSESRMPPPEVQTSKSKSQPIQVVDSPSSGGAYEGVSDTGEDEFAEAPAGSGCRDPFELFRARGVSFQVSVSLPNRPTGGDPPSLPPGVEIPKALLSCLPSRMCVSVYGCCLVWAMEWSTCFSRVPPVPPPRSRLTASRGRGISAGCKPSKASSFTSYSSGSSIGSSANFGSRTSAALKRLPNFPPSAKRLPGNPEAIDRGRVVSAKGPPESFADLVQGLRLGPVSLSEMDASLYDTAPENVNKRGIRVSIRGGVKMSLCFSVEKSDAIDPFTTGRVVIPTTGSMVTTTVHGLRLTAGKVEARLCDRHAGSRGAVFLRLNRVSLEQGGTGGRGDIANEALPEEGIPCERPRGHPEARKRPSGGGSSSGAKDSESNILGAGGIERIGEAGSVVRTKFAADEFQTGFDPELEGGSGGGGGDSRCRVVATDRRFWEGERVKLSKSGSSADGGDVYAHRGDQGGCSSRRRSSSCSSGGAEGLYQELDTEGFLQRSTLSSPASLSEERRARLGNPDCGVLPRVLPFFFVGDSDAAGVGLDVAGRSGASDTTKPLVRARSARIWASRGGVPPDLDLLPNQEFVEGLARVGEGSGNEGIQDDGDNGGGGESRRSASSSGETGADRSGLGREGVAPDEVLGVREAGAVHSMDEVAGSGMWDEELDAITRAAWLGSKQASRHRIFSSNASSTASAAAAAAACASRSRADSSRGSVASVPRHAPSPSAGTPRFSGGREPPPPALRPQRFPPSPIYGDSDADVGGGLAGRRESAAGGRATGGGGGGRENKPGEGHRVAGSGFLYRVVFDGLNVLVTLGVRDSLLLLVQSGMDVAFAAIPGLSNPSKALLAKEAGGNLLRGETKKRTSLDLQQFIDKRLALPGRRRESGSLTPYSKAERQSQDSVESLAGGRSSNPGGVASGGGAAIGITGGAGEGPVMHQLFSIELRRTQIQLLGAEIAKASLLFSMELAVVQGWVGLDPLEEASVSGRDTHTQQEDVVESCRLQSLAQRLLTTFREAVTVGLEGTMLSVAPSDVDVDAGVQWLPNAAFATKPATRLSQKSPGARKKQPPPHAPPSSPRPSHAEAQALLLLPSAANPSRAGDLGLDPTSEEVVVASPSAALVSVDFDGSSPRLCPDASPAAREAGTAAESMKDGGSAIDVGHLFPTSPMSMRSVASWSAGVGRESVGTGRWGVEASSGVLAAESPSRAKERAARKVLLREVGDASGVAAVLTGKTAAPSKGGLSENDVGLSGRSGPVERKYFAQQAVVVPRGRAVFKPVVNRIDSLEMQVLAHHGAVENNVIKIDLPSIKAALTSLQLKLVATVISEVLASPLPKLGMLKMHRGSFSGVPATSVYDPHSETPSAREGRGGTGIGLGGSPAPTVTDAWKSKRREEWKTLELCRLQHFISEASQHAGKRWSGYAPLESGSTRKAAVEPYGGALEHSRGEVVDAALSRLASAVEAEVESCADRSRSASDRLSRAVRTLKLKLQQRPNTHLCLHLKRLRLELWHDESSSPFLRAEVRRIAADVMVYDDSSGSLDLQVGSLWTSQLRGTGDAEGTPPKKTEGAADVSSEWWRAGGTGGEAAIMALEVIKPLTPQDLERLPDQGNMRGWTPRDITIHVQAQLGTPIGDMTLVRHFEAAVFPLVLYLRRSLFADLWSFSSEAVSALASGGAGPGPGATLREEQLKASFLVSRKTGAKGTKPGLGRTRLRRGWRAGKGSAAASTPNAEESLPPRDTNRSRKTSRSAGMGASGSGGGPSSPGDHDHDHDSASDGDSDGEEAVDIGHPPSPTSDVPSKEEQAAPGLMGKLMAVKHLRLGEVNIFLTYTGDRYLELEDVDNVHLKLHPLVYTNKKWTPRKLMLRIRRDACLDVLSQVSRNFSNLGSFLNTRLVPKSGGSSAYPSLGSTGGNQRGTQHGNATSAREKATKLWRTIPSPATGRNRGRPFSPTFLSQKFHAVSRSISPVPATDRAGAALSVGEQRGAAEARTSERSPGLGGEATAGKGHRKAWSGFKHTGPWAGSSLSPVPRGVSEFDDSEPGDDAGLTTSAAGAAVALRAGGGAEALSDSELVEGVLSPSRDSDGEGEIRLKAEEQNAKVLLFGRYLGGGAASSGGSSTNRSADTNSRMNRSDRPRGKFLTRLAFTSKRSGRDGSGGDVADGQG